MASLSSNPSTSVCNTKYNTSTNCWADEEEEDSEEEKQIVKPKSLLRSVLTKK